MPCCRAVAGVFNEKRGRGITRGLGKGLYKMKEHSQEWCDEMKKSCVYCQHTKYYCIEHEPWREHKSCHTWGGMNHQRACLFFSQLVNKEAHAVVRYCAIVQVDFCDDPNFNGRDIKCPDCEGWDIEIIKNI